MKTRLKVEDKAVTELGRKDLVMAGGKMLSAGTTALRLCWSKLWVTLIFELAGLTSLTVQRISCFPNCSH